MSNDIRNAVAAASLAIAAGAAALPAQAQVEIKPTHPNGEVSFIVDFEVKSGFGEEFETFSRRSALCARLDPGNIAFEIHKVIGAENRYLYYVIWRSPDALRSHLERPYTKALLGMFQRALARPLSESIRYITDMSPAVRPAPPAGDPFDNPTCRAA